VAAGQKIILWWCGYNIFAEFKGLTVAFTCSANEHFNLERGK
jgi:hypothetical protein